MKVEGIGFRVEGLGSRVAGLGFGVYILHRPTSIGYVGVQGYGLHPPSMTPADSCKMQ